MHIKALTIAVFILCVAAPGVVAGQTQDSPRPLDRFTFQVGGGPLLKSGGHMLSAGIGFSPFSRIDLSVNVEREQIPFQRDTFSDGYSITRGGTLTYVSGEIRASVFPPHRVSPYGFAGIGKGVSQPTVNSDFPTAIENKLHTVYFGAGLRVPLKGGISVFGDARAQMTLEGDDGILGVWPVRVGVSWRF